MSISVVSLGNRSESFLAGCVPHLQFDLLLINLQTFDLKIKPYRALVGLIESILDKSHQQGSFTAIWGTYNN